MGLNDGVSCKKSDTDDGGGVTIGKVGTIGSSIGFKVDDNDDLTNLTWLQDRNLLKSMTTVTIGGSGGVVGGGGNLKSNIVHFIKEENENVYPDDVCSSPDEDDEDGSNNKSDGCSSLPCSVPPVPYNPKIHIHAKPPYSFSSLIFMAIESSPSKALPVKDIYAWIIEHFPYYQNSPSGWKNTVRHNLSLNKCFKKLDKGNDELVPIVGKGSLWCVDPDLRPNLLQAVRRTPAHIYPYMSTAKTDFKVTPNDLSSFKNRSHNDSRKILTFDQIPQITNSPLLGKRLLIPIINRESEEADAAQSMLTLTRYNSEESKSLTTNKSEPNDEHVNDDAYSTSTYNNPTSDHNYFSRSYELKKNNLKLLTEAQKLIESEVHISTAKLSVTPEKPDKIITTIKTDAIVESQLKKEPTDTIDEKKLTTDNDKKVRGTVLVKRKVDINDEDGLKGAQALLNLASRGLEVKVNEEKNKQLKQQQSQTSISLSSTARKIVDHVTSKSADISSIGLIKRRRERGLD